MPRETSKKVNAILPCAWKDDTIVSRLNDYYRIRIKGQGNVFAYRIKYPHGKDNLTRS